MSETGNGDESSGMTTDPVEELRRSRKDLLRYCGSIGNIEEAKQDTTEAEQALQELITDELDSMADTIDDIEQRLEE